MRHTLSSLITLCQNGAGKDTSTPSKTFFKQRLSQNYEFVISKLPSHLSEIPRTFSTVATQQYYHYPPSYRRVSGLEITIGSKKYPLTPVFSQDEWNRLNAITIQSGAIPTRYFNRQRDFGIYPIPQDVYTGTIVYNIRAGGLVREDYVTGTCTVVENSQTVEGAGGVAWSTTSNVQADDWFVLTDSNGLPRGSWYRIGSVTDADTLSLESVFEETGEAGATYLIGQSLELPEDIQEVPAFLSLGDYFAGFRQSQTKAQFWYNKAYTGDGDKTSRDPKIVFGGLIGAIKQYQDRNESQLIDRHPRADHASMKVWASELS